MDVQSFTHKGFMLDVCRHYMPAEDIRRMLDAAALCGMNRMHWHLTDDQGWRIEIKKYPLLTDIGAKRGPSFFGDVSQTENNCGFYTQEEVRGIVAYAKKLGIEIIPEIEIPGHACAMLAAYPQLGCRRTVWPEWTPTDGQAGYVHAVRKIGGIFSDLVCAGRDESIRFLEDVLDEITELFPFPMVHIGGDEAPKLHWRRCPDCQARMRTEGIRSEDALQRWLVLRIGAYLADKGKETIVWNDVLNGGLLPEHFIVQQWYGNQELTRAFLEAGGRVIVSDTENYYFDYAYGETDVYRIWNHPLIPSYAQGLESGLLGVECPLWTERITNTARAAYMLFPRMTAVGLRLNTPKTASWEEFALRLREKQAQIDALGLTGAPESFWRMTPEEARADLIRDEALKNAPCAVPGIQWERQMHFQEALERLLEKIDMPLPLAAAARDYALGELDGEAAPLPDDLRGADVLAEQLLKAVENRENGPWREIEEEIWIDTMKAFSRFVREHFSSYGFYGFDRGYWTTRQRDAKLFRLGELEYELLRGEDGKAELWLHIPSDARLEPERLNDSLAKARTFLKKHFPEWTEAPIQCESWLLSPALKELLPPGSRILMFQAAFDLTETDPEPDDVLQWIFGLAEAQKAAAKLEDLPGDTTLRRNAKAYMLEGGRIGTATGILARAFI